MTAGTTAFRTDSFLVLKLLFFCLDSSLFVKYKSFAGNPLNKVNFTTWVSPESVIYTEYPRYRSASKTVRWPPKPIDTKTKTRPQFFCLEGRGRETDRTVESTRLAEDVESLRT